MAEERFNVAQERGFVGGRPRGGTGNPVGRPRTSNRARTSNYKFSLLDDDDATLDELGDDLIDAKANNKDGSGIANEIASIC